ncbi:MAG: tetratricopeptide repeat protein [Alistipes sp.]|nr:tetratricopeptide repeat protein [Alistipes sp.]
MSHNRPIFNPTPDQTFELEGRGDYDFVRHLNDVESLVREARYDEACEIRYAAFQHLADILLEEEVMPLRWEHANSRAAMSILYGSAVDHFRIGDVEMTMAQLEMLLDCDPEDHFEAINLLALCYVATEEWEAYEDITIDLTDKSAEAVVAQLWASQRRDKRLDGKLLATLKARHKAYWEELIVDEHPADEAYLKDIGSNRPSQSAEAREWWLLTEPLWHEFPDFVNALRMAK